MFQHIKHPSCRRDYRVSPIHVQSHLSVSPAEMLDMSEHGIAISSYQDSSKFIDGDTSPLIDIAVENRRGFDVNQAWNLSQESKSKLRKAVKMSLSQPKDNS